MGGVTWHVVDASKTVTEVQNDVKKIAEDVLEKVRNGAPLLKLFEDGEYKLPQPLDKS